MSALPRVVSLLPAATEMVAALGATDALVAISHECDHPPSIRHLPRVTASVVDPRASSLDIDAAVRRLAESGAAVFAIDAELVTRLAPTLVITQAVCEVCAVGEGGARALGDLLDPAPAILALGATTLDGVWRDVRAVDHALGGDGNRADALLASLAARLQEVHLRLKAARAPRPRVAVIEWLDPLYAAGHWTPELVRRAGGIDVLAEPGVHSVPVSMQRIRDAAPELLLFAPCGFDVHRAEREAAALLASDEWRWAGGLEAWALDGNALTSRPGPRLADAVEVMAAIFAPSLFAAPSAAHATRLGE